MYVCVCLCVVCVRVHVLCMCVCVCACLFVWCTGLHVSTYTSSQYQVLELKLYIMSYIHYMYKHDLMTIISSLT